MQGSPCSRTSYTAPLQPRPISFASSSSSTDVTVNSFKLSALLYELLSTVSAIFSPTLQQRFEGAEPGCMTSLSTPSGSNIKTCKNPVIKLFYGRAYLSGHIVRSQEDTDRTETRREIEGQSSGEQNKVRERQRRLARAAISCLCSPLIARVMRVALCYDTIS